MPDYVPPLRDIRFVLEHVVDVSGLSRLAPFGHADTDAVFGVLEEGGRFMAEVLAPLNRVGDVEGSRIDQAANVVTPTGFKSAYRQYVDAGWGAVPFSPEFGGGGFPVADHRRAAGDADLGQHGVLAVPAADPGRHRHAEPRTPRPCGACCMSTRNRSTCPATTVTPTCATPATSWSSC